MHHVRSRRNHQLHLGRIGGSPINRRTALRWIADDRRTAQDIEQLLWEHGLIYSRKFVSYTNEILEAVHG